MTTLRIKKRKIDKRKKMYEKKSDSLQKVLVQSH